MINKKKIAVVYDTSYLLGDFQSIKKFILSHRFSSQEKTGLFKFKSLSSVMTGKGRPEQTVRHDPNDLFVVIEIIPSEVIHEIENQFPGVEQERKVIANLLADGALKVDLAMDTVVSSMAPADIDTEEKLALFAQRLVSHVTLEKYALAIVATEDDQLLTDLAEKAKSGSAVMGVKSEHLTRTRILHDKLTEVANWDRTAKVIMENR